MSPTGRLSVKQFLLTVFRKTKLCSFFRKNCISSLTIVTIDWKVMIFELNPILKFFLERLFFRVVLHWYQFKVLDVKLGSTSKVDSTLYPIPPTSTKLLLVPYRNRGTMDYSLYFYLSVCLLVILSQLGFNTFFCYGQRRYIVFLDCLLLLQNFVRAVT